MTPNEQLKRLMIRHKLIIKDIVKLSGYSLPGIQHWLAEEGSPGYRKLKPIILDMIKIKLRNEK